MAFKLDQFLDRHHPQAPEPNLDRLFSDPARAGVLMEMPQNLPHSITEEIDRKIRKVQFNRYPSAEAARLRKQIARWLDLPSSHGALLGNGALPLIELVIQCFGAAKNVLTLEPDFFVYDIAAQKYDANRKTVALDPSFSLDPERFLAEIENVQPELVVLSNPHNPTSVSFESCLIEAVLKRTKGIVLIDEVYCAFGPDPNACCSLLAKYPNLLILRSFSKLGAAAIRFGFLLGDKRIVDLLGAWQLPFAVNSMSLLVAGLVIDHYSEIKGNVETIISERDAMIRRFSKFPEITVYPSSTNFIVVRVHRREAQDVYRDLVEQGVSVMHYRRSPALQNCLRIGVAGKANNTRAMEQLEKALSR